MKSFVTVALAAIGASSALAARDNGHMKLVKKATANGPTDVEILNYGKQSPSRSKLTCSTHSTFNS